MGPILRRAMTLALLVAGLAGAEAATVPAGEVALVTGQAQASNQATLDLRALEKGDPVYSGDIVSAGPNAYVNLKFTDGSFVLIRPNTRFEIEAYRAPDEPTEATAADAPSATTAPAANGEAIAATPAPAGRGQAFFRLLKGGFRAVTGLIGRSDPAEYRISTPVATIGIRGTDYLAIICDAACASDPVILASLLPGCPENTTALCDMPLPEGLSALGGIVVGVISGRVVTANIDGREVEVGPGQFLLTLTDGTQILLPQPPGFLKLNPIPDPTELCDT